MNPELINFIDWLAIAVLVVSLLRIGGTMHNSVSIPDNIQKSIELKYEKGELRTNPFEANIEIALVILTIIWLVVM